MRYTALEKRLQKKYTMSYQWIKNKNNGLNIGEYLKKQNVNSIAIYGAGDYAELLIEELRESEVCVRFCIDRNAKEIQSNYIISDVVTEDILNEQNEVETLIISLVDGYENVKERMTRYFKKIYTLEQIIIALGVEIWIK